MTYAARETSGYLGLPFELYLFQTTTNAWRLTSGDVSRTYLGREFTPEAIDRTEIDQNQESQSGEIKITLPRTHEIALLFTAYIPSSPVSVVIYRGHDGDAEVVTNFTGRVVKAEFDEECVLSVVPESDLLRKRIPCPKFQTPCNRILFDDQCGVSRSLFSITATLATVASDILTSAAFDAKPDGWFQNGYIERGQERRMILTHTGDTIRLISPIAGLAAGETITAFAGCQRTAADCASKFSNLENFWGFDRIPTRNPFDGGLE